MRSQRRGHAYEGLHAEATGRKPGSEEVGIVAQSFSQGNGSIQAGQVVYVDLQQAGMVCQIGFAMTTFLCGGGEHHSGEPLLLRIACFFFGELSESQDARTPLAAFELVEYFEQWAILPLAPDAAEIAAGRIGCVHRCVVLNTLRSVAIHEFKVRLHQELSASMIRIITRRAGWAKVPRLCYA